MCLGIRKTALPLVQVIGVKNKVAPAPTDQHGYMCQLMQILIHIFNQAVAGIFFADRNILNKFKGCDAVSPAVVWGCQAGFNSPGQSFVSSHGQSPPGKKIESLNSQSCKGPDIAHQPESHGKLFTLGRKKGGGVHNYQSANPLWMFQGIGHTDHASPVVQHEGNVIVQSKMIKQGLQVINAAFQSVIIFAGAGFVRQAAADMIRHNNTELRGQISDKFPKIKRPCRIPMNHYHCITGTFVQKVVLKTVPVHKA